MVVVAQVSRTVVAAARYIPDGGTTPTLAVDSGVSTGRAQLAPTLPRNKLLLVNLSGRGDKDLASVAEYLDRRG